MAINKKRLQGAAETTALVPSENFNTVLYTGNSASGVTQSISVGFQPDLIWFKNRTGTNFHAIVDSVRTRANYVYPNDTLAENDGPASAAGRDVASFDTNGFTVGQTSVASSTNEGSVVAWCFKAPDAFSHLASGSQLASTGKSNQAAGFSIVSYTGNNSSGATVKHNLGDEPELMIVKRRDATGDWDVYSATTQATKYLILDTNQSVLTASNIWNNTPPDGSVFTIGNHSSVNANNGTYIAYCFKSITEYSKVGTYTGNNSTSNFVDCGFEPAWLLVKRTDADANWRIVDNKRNTTNPRNSALYPSLPNAEYTNAVENVNFTTTGFEIATTDLNWNASNGNYIFYAIAADPDTTTPTLAKSFNIDTYTGNGATQQIGSVNTLFTKYAVFNGSSSLIVTPSDFSGSTVAGSSISFWFRTTNSKYQNIFGNSTGFTYGSSISLGNAFGAVANESITFINEKSGSTEAFMTTEGTSAYADGVWRHAVFVSTSTTKAIYINGVSKTLTFFGGSASSDADLENIQFGLSKGAASSTTFDGSLDQVRIYNTAINQAAVTQLYNETQATASTLNFPTGAGCLALYEFNDDADDTGNNYDGNPANVTYDSFLFKPDLVIIKNRDTTDGWRWFDTQRGVLNRLESSATSAAADLANSLTAFNNAGFTLGSEATVNTSSEDYVSFSFKMLDNNNNVPVENEVGTIDTLVSANPSAGMSIVKYIGNGTQDATIGTGLSSAPDMVIVKSLETQTVNNNWAIFHSGVGTSKYLDFTTADAHDTAVFPTVSATTVALRDSQVVNTNAKNYIAYCFHSVSGFSKFGTYTGSGGSGKIIYTTDDGTSSGSNGFLPDFVVCKRTDDSGNWMVFNSKMNGTASNADSWVSFESNAAQNSSYNYITFNSNNFTWQRGGTSTNELNGEYIYWAMKIN